VICASYLRCQEQFQCGLVFFVDEGVELTPMHH